jgi:hypothetical protein
MSPTKLELLKATLSAGVALITLTLTWFVTTRVTTSWNIRQKQRELALSSAEQFYALYGEFFAIWKLWDQHLRSGAPKSSSGDDPGSQLLRRTLAAEAGVEAMLLKLTGQQVLSHDELYALGSFRQGYQTLRGRIRQGKPIGWNWDSHPEYAAFKYLASQVSQALLSWRSTKLPSPADQYHNFRIITANYWEQKWVQIAQAQGCNSTSWTPPEDIRPATRSSQ